jgi:hypothetical protein
MTQWAGRRPSIGLERAKSLIATDCQESLCVFTQRGGAGPSKKADGVGR